MSAITDRIADFILRISEVTGNFWRNIDIAQYSGFQIALDILLVAVLFYWLIMVIRGTRATNIVLGLVFIALVFALSRWLNLIALGWLLDRLLTVTLVAIPIIFQQEIRRGLEKLGRTKFFLAQEAKEIDFLCSELISSSFKMAKSGLGGLLVIRGEVSLKEYVDTGVMLNARISKELVQSIFSRGAPLHDGAIIIDQNRIVAAGCVLPHSFKEYGHSFGTRHKAALGLSESTDASIIVVSEERGEVSFVHSGLIQRDITPERLQKILIGILTPKKATKKKLHVS